MKKTSQGNPEASLLLTGHNQAPYIKEAIEGAFAQTYPNLEIILSDDASTDDTYPIMRGMAEAYRGPHRVVLNRCERNLGVAAHISELAKRAQGRFLFIAAGDDVSMPERVSRCMEAWAKSKVAPSMVFTNLRPIDEIGRELQPAFFLAREKRPGVMVGLAFAQHYGPADVAELTTLPESLYRCVIGASMAFDRALIDEFGPLDRDLTVEDVPLSFRARLAGRVEFIDEPLVDYRRHGGNFMPDESSEESRVRVEDRDHRSWIAFTRVYLRDAKTARSKGMIGGSAFRKLRAHILYAHYRRRAEVGLRDRDYRASVAGAVGGMLKGGRRLHFGSWLLREYAPALARTITDGRNKRGCKDQSPQIGDRRTAN